MISSLRDDDSHNIDINRHHVDGRYDGNVNFSRNSNDCHYHIDSGNDDVHNP